jgi:hypothetical protein
VKVRGGLAGPEADPLRQVVVDETHALYLRPSPVPLEASAGRGAGRRIR